MENCGEYTVRGSVKKYKIVCKDVDAYLLGYLSCDGGYITNNGYPFMMVSSTEEYIISWIKREYLPDSRIIPVGLKSSNLVKATNNVFEIRWAGKASEQFNRFGIFCKKPSRRIVNIPNRVMPQYIAGCIDADGFITVSHRKDCRSPRIRFFITHAGEMFLTDLQNKLELLGVSTTLRQHGSHVWRLQAQNTTQNIQFLKTIVPFLKNKKKLNIVNNYLKYFVPQESGELLETLTGNQQPSLQSKKVQRLPEHSGMLNNRK